MSKKVLLTGGSGFVGSHVVDHLLANTDWHIFVLDRLNYAGSLERLAHHKGDSRVEWIFHDFRGEFPASVLHRLNGVDFIIHNGAESHVDRSISDPEPFVMSNVVGTMRVLEAAKRLGVARVLYTSTDEVLGPAPEGIDFCEDSPILPSNPYSAAKAGGEALCYAYWKSYMVPVVISRTMNLIGQRQHPEKFVPMCIRRILNGEVVTIHGNSQVIGSRKWLHARNQADAILFLLTRGDEVLGQTYHVVGVERTNLEIAELIANFMGKQLKYELVDFHAVRLGHDRRYSLCDHRIREMGWQPPVDFLTSLEQTVEWTLRPENLKWLAETPMPKAMAALNAE